MSVAYRTVPEKVVKINEVLKESIVFYDAVAYFGIQGLNKNRKTRPGCGVSRRVKRILSCH